MTWPYRCRRAALEELFREHQLTAAWALCPSTTDPDTVREWLTSWTAAGLEGVVLKRLDSPYRPSARGWLKYEVRETTKAIVGAVTGPVAAAPTLLLVRYDAASHFQYTGRTTTLPQTDGRTVAGLLTPAGAGHPWTGWSFSAGWGSRETLDVALARPELMVGVGVDVARDASGRWRHPARWHRARPDLSPTDVTLFNNPG